MRYPVQILTMLLDIVTVKCSGRVSPWRNFLLDHGNTYTSSSYFLSVSPSNCHDHLLSNSYLFTSDAT